LEAAGLWAHDHEASGCADDCHNDSCATVEDGGYNSGTRSLGVFVPVVVITGLASLIALPAKAEAAPVVSPATTDSPPELACTWQFTARMALLPGAPSVLV
jgi:hypothetical protein